MKAQLIAKGIYSIEVDATPDDLLARGNRCAELTKEIEALNEEKKGVMQDYKHKIDIATSIVSNISSEIRRKKCRINNANCTEFIYPDEKLYRMYWGEIIVEERPMTEEEIIKYCSGIFQTEPVQRQEDVANDIKDVIRLETHVKTKSAHT
jgi:hypothetical protein